MAILFAGIDNGLSGGLVLLDSCSNVLAVTEMPTFKVGKDRYVDALEVSNWFVKHKEDNFVVAGLEKAAKFSRGTYGLTSTHDSFGACRAVLALNDKIDCKIIDAKTWQDHFFPKKRQKGQSKTYSIQKAKKLWPNQSWKRTKRCTTNHDGFTDAALIAEYVRRSH